MTLKVISILKPYIYVIMNNLDTCHIPLIKENIFSIDKLLYYSDYLGKDLLKNKLTEN